MWKIENVSNDAKAQAKGVSEQNTERDTCLPFGAYNNMWVEEGKLKKKFSFSAKSGGTVKNRQNLLDLKIKLFFIPYHFREQKNLKIKVSFREKIKCQV